MDSRDLRYLQPYPLPGIFPNTLPEVKKPNNFCTFVTNFTVGKKKQNHQMDQIEYLDFWIFGMVTMKT